MESAALSITGLLKADPIDTTSTLKILQHVNTFEIPPVAF